MADETFCLKWNDYQKSFNLGFKDIRLDHDLFDVTLVSDDNEEIEAHKLILSACSSFFKTILKRRKHQHPLIYIKGTNSSELSAILDFMYQGEVNVEQKNLEKFLEAASDLKIKGLTRDTVGEQVSTVYSGSTNHALQSHSNSSNLLQSSNLQSYEEISKVGMGMEYSETQVRKVESFDDLASSTDGHEYQDIPDVKDEEVMKYQNGVWLCNVCGKSDRNKYNIKYHTEIHTDTSAHYCSYCGKSYKTKNSLRYHKYKSHASEKIIQQLGHVV